MRRAVTPLRLALPKGRIETGVLELLREAGIRLSLGSRDYRPSLNLPGFDVKVLKPQNIVEMVALGSRDIGFAGADWVAELNVELIEVLDTGLDPVRLVAAAPTSVLVGGKLPKRTLIIASEYERLTKKWIEQKNIDATFVKSYGATEVFPPEDADCIVDITASGRTLGANNLEIFDELCTSTTRLYVHPRVMDDPVRRNAIDALVMLLRSVLNARRRVMLEVNVSAECLEALVEALPAMREPTIAALHGNAGYAVKAAVPRQDLPRLIPELKARGGTDLVVTTPSQIIP